VTERGPWFMPEGEQCPHCGKQDGIHLYCSPEWGERARVYHGLSKTAEYSAWTAMVARCTRPYQENWKYYGGRGIQVCAEWLNDPQAFIDYMGPKPGPEYSLDRIDVDGNYEPGNVRWADRVTQANNKRPRGAKVTTPAREEPA